MPAVPQTLAEITPDWLTAVLQERLPGAAIADLAIAVLPNTANYNGTLAQLLPDYAARPDGAPDSLVAKLVPQNPQMRDLGVALGVYRREAALYREIGPATGIKLPDLYGYAEDGESGLSALLLADLSHLRTGDQLAGYTPAEAEATVVQYARQHARWWAHRDLDGLAWLPAWNEPAMVELALGAYRQIWPACRAAFEDSLPKEAIRLGEQLTGVLGDMMNAVAAPPVTLLHGDARHENLMFDRADDSLAPYVVDWQLTARGRGVMDIAYYLTQSGAPDIAQAHERRLVEIYHEQLRAGGVTDYSFAQCWEDYRRFAYYALVYPVITAGLIDAADQQQRSAVGVILERAVSAALRLDAGEFTGS